MRAPANMPFYPPRPVRDALRAEPPADVLDDHGVAEGLACLSMLERFNYFRESHQVNVSRDEAIDILTRAVFEGFFVPDRTSTAVRRPRRVRKAG